MVLSFSDTKLTKKATDLFGGFFDKLSKIKNGRISLFTV
jgi:hypothetical protein